MPNHFRTVAQKIPTGPLWRPPRATPPYSRTPDYKVPKTISWNQRVKETVNLKEPWLPCFLAGLGSRINNFMRRPLQDKRIEFPTEMLMNKVAAARYLAVSVKTIEAYEKAGLIRKWKNPTTRKVYYDKAEIFRLLGSRLDQKKDVIIYARSASLPDHIAAGGSVAKRLSAQVERIEQYCTARGIRIDRIITDIGEGTSLKHRSGFNELMELIMRRQVSTVVIENPDRIARWAGQDLMERVLAWHGVDLHIISQCWEREEYRLEAKEDLANILYKAKILMGEKIATYRPGEKPPLGSE